MKKSIKTFLTIAAVFMLSIGFSAISGGNAAAASYSGNMKISGNMHMGANIGYVGSSQKKSKKKDSGSSKAKSKLNKMGAGCL